MRTARSRIGALILGVAITTTLLVAPPHPTGSATGPAFTCEPGFYQVVSGQLKRLDFENSTYVDIGSQGNNANALGYNTEDDLLYATRNGNANDPNGADLLRIYADGTVENLGQIGLPPSNPAWFGGDFDGLGNLYVVNTTGVWVKIDVSAVDGSGAGITQLTLSGGSPAPADFSIINGVAYGIDNGTRNLVRVDLATLTVTSIDMNGKGLPSAVYGASFVSNGNRFYVSNNTTGVIYEIQGYDTETPLATAFATAGSTSQNDGAACPDAANPSGGEFAVRFDLGGGTGTTPTAILDLAEGDVSTLPGDSGFSRDGFTFDGWDCDQDVGTVQGGGSLTQPAADVLCTALWTPVSADTYSVTFDLGGGTGTTPADITGLDEGDVSTLPGDSGFSRDGFTFDGWDCDQDVGTVQGGGQITQPAADVLCTALWTPVSADTYSVTFDLGGGTGTTPADITGLDEGDVSTLPGDSGFSRDGFTFDGWDCDQDVGTVQGGGSLTQPAADVLCTALWTPVSADTYSVAFDLGGGTGTTPADITGLDEGDVSTLPGDSGFSRDGFTFNGWDCDEGVGSVAAGGQITQPAADVLCTARWTSLVPTRIPAGDGGTTDLLAVIIGSLMLAGVSVCEWHRQRALNS
jgi:uncharacterized repeat protein (TIGR02543 family)